MTGESQDRSGGATEFPPITAMSAVKWLSQPRSLTNARNAEALI